MKLFIPVFVFFASISSFASESTSVKCKATHNYKIVIEQTLDITKGSVGVKVGEYDDFAILLNQKNESFELELYKISEESRSYAKAQLREAGDKVELARWTREYIFDVSCERTN